jgi:hypothetical protein
MQLTSFVLHDLHVRANLLLKKVRVDLESKNYGSDDIRMDEYNDLLRTCRRQLPLDPVLAAMPEMPDEVMKAEFFSGRLARPPAWGTERLASHLERLVGRLASVRLGAAIAAQPEVLRRRGNPPSAGELDAIGYLRSAEFRARFPAALNKWQRANALVQSGEDAESGSQIGLLCREAIQEFADALVQECSLTDVPPRTATVVRMRLVLAHHKKRLGETKHGLLEALLPLWEAVIELAQRQTHAGERERETLEWEDGRRAVFQTANVMFEVARTLRSI